MPADSGGLPHDSGNVVLFFLGLILICGLLYFLVDVRQGDLPQQLALEPGWLANLTNLGGYLFSAG